MYSTFLIALSALRTIHAEANDPIAITTWPGVSQRADLFGLTADGDVWHKYHNEHGWDPVGLENLSSPDADLDTNKSVPTAVSFADNHLQLFVISEAGKPYTRWWSDSQWEPEHWQNFYDTETEGDISFQSKLAAVSWGVGRIDVFGHNESGTYLHKYYTGRDWSKWEDIWPEQKFSSPPAVTSWGANRFDVFGVDHEGTVLHQAWQGDAYFEKFEALPNAVSGGLKDTSLTATSSGEGQLAVWAVGKNDSQLYSTVWYPGGYQAWSALGGNFEATPKVLRRTATFLDVVGHSGKSGDGFDYKIWAGHWQPSESSWWSLKGSWNSLPAIASWSEDVAAVFGIDGNGILKWSWWSGEKWETWHELGDTKDPFAENKLAAPASQEVLRAKEEV
ncbi:hypothetical protein Slin14017_G099860 [Septoria linicola]|nr:hypothetical protein Slin14017_G099860 [Septoria linicola]